MSDLPAIVPLTAYRGDTWTQTFRLKQDTTPVDLTTATIAASAAAPSGLVVTFTVTKTNPTGGEFQLSWNPVSFPGGSYAYDVEVTQGGAVTTWIRGSLMVTADVTIGLVAG